MGVTCRNNLLIPRSFVRSDCGGSPVSRALGRSPTTARSAMSKLGKFFKGTRSSRARAAPSTQEALARLRETEEMLAKKQEYLENRIQRELALAKKHGSQNKRGRLCPRPSGSHPLPALPWGHSPPRSLRPSRTDGLPF